MRFVWFFMPLSLLLGASLDAQDQPKLVTPTARIVPVDPVARPRDAAKLPASAQPIFRSAHRGMDWLRLANKPDGRFVYGFLPALRMPMDGDNFISQAGAAYALAKASRYFGDERTAVVARQALLTLLLETTLDSRDPTVRHTAAPPQTVNRLAAHGYLILAIHELAPSKDLLDQADQLCNYLRKLQREDGALMSREGDAGKRDALSDLEVQQAGIALHAIARSQRQRPADWKLATLKRARDYYFTHWQTSKTIGAVATHAPAYAEAYFIRKEAPFVDAVFAMNDWLIGLQYQEDASSQRKHWVGGFPNGRNDTTAPTVLSALPGNSLAEACRVARHTGDLTRGQRFERALILNLQFVMALQYTDRKVEHFVDTFRPALLGGFHASHQNGDLRIDYTQHAIGAMVQYLEAVIE